MGIGRHAGLPRVNLLTDSLHRSGGISDLEDHGAVQAFRPRHAAAGRRRSRLRGGLRRRHLRNRARAGLLREDDLQRHRSADPGVQHRAALGQIRLPCLRLAPGCKPDHRRGRPRLLKAEGEQVQAALPHNGHARLRLGVHRRALPRRYIAGEIDQSPFRIDGGADGGHPAVILRLGKGGKALGLLPGGVHGAHCVPVIPEHELECVESSVVNAHRYGKAAVCVRFARLQQDTGTGSLRRAGRRQQAHRQTYGQQQSERSSLHFIPPSRRSRSFCPFPGEWTKGPWPFPALCGRAAGVFAPTAPDFIPFLIITFPSPHFKL